ncbi:MAG: MBL fold metallo-hydrolase [Parcubacteria group bacterium]|nr:MBL fold metallo-hydrolase [Parcubacteria group bacterium]
MPYKKILIAILCVAGCATIVFGDLKNRDFSVTVFDVGQGDALYISHPFGWDMLIDGGADNTVLSRLGESQQFWDRRIDVMVLTHPDMDHLFGLLAVAKRYEIGEIWLTGVDHGSQIYARFLDIVSDLHISVKTLDQVRKIRIFDMDIAVLYPDSSVAGKKFQNVNNTSVVMRLDYQGSSFLFAGDIEKEQEEYLAERYPEIIDADFLKVAHHGSKTSSSMKFLMVVRPDIALISVGRENAFGHPSAEVVKRFASLKIPIYRTDTSGTITVSVGQNGKTALKEQSTVENFGFF